MVPCKTQLYSIYINNYHNYPNAYLENLLKKNGKKARAMLYPLKWKKALIHFHLREGCYTYELYK